MMTPILGLRIEIKLTNSTRASFQIRDVLLAAWELIEGYEALAASIVIGAQEFIPSVCLFIKIYCWQMSFWVSMGVATTDWLLSQVDLAHTSSWCVCHEINGKLICWVHSFHAHPFNWRMQILQQPRYLALVALLFGIASAVLPRASLAPWTVGQRLFSTVLLRLPIECFPRILLRTSASIQTFVQQLFIMLIDMLDWTHCLHRATILLLKHVFLLINWFELQAFLNGFLILSRWKHRISFKWSAWSFVEWRWWFSCFETFDAAGVV